MQIDHFAISIPTPYDAAGTAQVQVQRWLAAGADPAAIPVVLLHESLGSIGQWRSFPAQLAEALQRPVLAYDRLGFGQSTPRIAPPSFGFIEEEAQQCFPALMQALGLERYALLGHSIGGVMALHIAAAQPQACAAVMSLSAQAFVEERTLEGIRQAQRFFADPAQWARLEKWHGERTRWVFDAWTEVWLHPDFQSWRIDTALAGVTCPVLTLHGRQDEYGSTAFAQHIHSGHAQAAGSELVLLDCAHHPHFEQAEAVLAACAGFAARVL